jgi:hypothetical protein
MDDEELLGKHSRFAGDLDHLRPFARVAASSRVIALDLEPAQ